MSVIVDFLIVIDGYDARAMEQVNARLRELDTERGQEFREIDMSQAGGSKVFCDDVWAGAFNHLLPETIRQAICEADWPLPEDVLVIESSGDCEIDLRARSITELRAASAERKAS